MRSTVRFRPSAVVMDVVVRDVVEPGARVPIMKTLNGAERALSTMPEDSTRKEASSIVWVPGVSVGNGALHWKPESLAVLSQVAPASVCRAPSTYTAY